MRQVDLAASLREEGNVPAALERLRSALEYDPENVEAFLLLAYIEASRSDYVSAEQHAREGVRLLVEHQAEGGRLAEARNLLGGVLMNLGRMEEAIEMLRASAVDPYNHTPHMAWYNLAMAQSAGGHADDAIASLGEAVRLRGTFCDAFYGMGQLYCATERWPECEAALTRAVTVDPACGTAPTLQGAWRLRGDLRHRQGRNAEATSDFERCIELGPDTEDGLHCQSVLDAAP